jgi:multiple sugar transport system substrate-binding protein
MKRRICTAALLLAAALGLSAAAHARPLRVWVMNNDAAIGSPKVSETEVRAAIDRWRSEGIIIENTPSNLLLPAETKYPLASHILGDNNFIRQVADYRKLSGDSEPVAIEFIRWDDAYNRIISALGSDDIDSSPDIAQVGHSWAVGLANRGRIADVGCSIDGGSFYPPQMVGSDSFESEGLFAVPWFSEIRLLYYDKETIPSADALADWGSFLSTCEAYTKRTGKPFVGFATTINWNLLHNMAPWLWAGGGDVVKASNLGPFTLPRVALDSPQSLSGMLYLKKLSESGCAAFPNTSQEMVDRAFLEGEFAVIITGPWITRLMGPGWRERYGVTSLPAGPNGNQPFVGGSHLVVSAASKARGNFDRAVSFVRFLTSPASQAKFNRMSGFYPVNREALGAFLESDADGLFKKAVERGLTYPAIVDWGDVVENEFIRSHLWHIWRDIAQGVPDDTLIATVENAAASLRTNLYMSQAKRAAPYAAAVVSALLAAGIAIAEWSRRRLRATSRLCDEKSAELARIHAERTVLEGKALLLERHDVEQSAELSRLKRDLRALGERANSLKAELASCAPKKPGDERRIGSFSIGWDGSLTICGERIRFENNRQARRLMEQLVRGAGAGRPSLHCLWGYALFGWRPTEIQSHPKRLFEIMASKINAQIKAHGAPPIVVKAGKGSFSWKLGWDRRLVLDKSDVFRSASEAELASRSLAEGEVEAAYSHAMTALELDPKNIEALSVLRDALNSSDPGEQNSARMESMLKISEGILARDIEAMKGGIEAVESIASSKRLPKGIDRDSLEEELAGMKGAASYLEGRLATIFRTVAGERGPAFLGDILERLTAIQGEIVALKARGASDEALWAQVAGSQSFLDLMAVPHVNNLVSNFYNNELKAKEDPRLVQLALISMLSQEGALQGLGTARDERDVIAAMRKELTKEIDSLADSMGLMS